MNNSLIDNLKPVVNLKKKKQILVLFLILFLAITIKPSYAHHNPTFGFAGTAGPILTNPADTIPKGHFAVGIRTEYVNFNEYSRAALKYFAKKRQFVHGAQYFLSPAVVAAYGLTDDLTLAIRVPYGIQSGIKDGALNSFGIPIIINRGTAHGLGDLGLFAQYRFLNLKDKKFESAILTGITIPSGLAHVKDNLGERFGADHQPSKRSFDPLIGLSISKHFTPRFSFDSNYLYTIAVKGIQNFDSGDLHNYNASLSYRLIQPHQHHHHHANGHEHQHTYGGYDTHKYQHTHTHEHKWYSKLGLDTILEMNGEWRQKQVFGIKQGFGFTDEDSGGSTIYLSPGLRLAIGETLSTYVSFGLPVICDPNGDGQKTDFRILFGLSKSF